MTALATQRSAATYSGTRLDTFRPESLGDTLGLTQFRGAVRDLLDSRVGQVGACRDRVRKLLRGGKNPARLIGELLDICVREGGPDALDHGIDVLTGLDRLLFEYALDFFQKHARSWNRQASRSTVADDAWYILIRALARSTRLNEQMLRLPLIRAGLDYGTPSVRDACVHALGDIGGQMAKLLLIGMASDEDAGVRQSARELLEE